MISQSNRQLQQSNLPGRFYLFPKKPEKNGLTAHQKQCCAKGEGNDRKAMFTWALKVTFATCECV